MQVKSCDSGKVKKSKQEDKKESFGPRNPPDEKKKKVLRRPAKGGRRRQDGKTRNLKILRRKVSAWEGKNRNFPSSAKFRSQRVMTYVHACFDISLSENLNHVKKKQLLGGGEVSHGRLKVPRNKEGKGKEETGALLKAEILASSLGRRGDKSGKKRRITRAPRGGVKKDEI